MATRFLRVTITCLALLAAPLDARGQETAVVEARAIFNAAREHFDKGRYAKALADLERAYAIKKLTVFIRYMGDCNMKLKRYEQALSAYTRYLRKMPDAKDREVVAKEMEVARGKLIAQRKEAYAGKRLPTALMPTGRDQEDPVQRLAKKVSPALPEEPEALDQPSEPSSTLGVAKWAAGGLALFTMALGVTFNRLAVAKSDDLIEAVKQACPPGSTGQCNGNPKLVLPIVTYSKEHLQMELEVDQFNELAVASFVVGGAAAAASVTLFILDWLGKRERRGAAPRVTIAPVMSGDAAMLWGEVTF